MTDSDAETAERINEITAKYGEQELLCVGERDNKKMQKIRGYFLRHIANTDARQADAEKTYCDIWEFLNRLDTGSSRVINQLGYKIAFDIESADKMFMYKLNESDFLTLNFILISYALSKSIFGNLDIRFEANVGAAVLIYEFSPGSDFVKLNSEMFESGGFDNFNNFDKFAKSGSIDLELAALIAENNHLKLELRTNDGDDNININSISKISKRNKRNSVEGTVQIWLHFISSGDLSQMIAGYENIMSGEDIARRAEIELAFLERKSESESN
jgi:hypothetical protein